MPPRHRRILALLALVGGLAAGGLFAQPTTPSPGLKYYYPAPEAPVVDVEADIVVYGGSSGGVAAAVQAARMGREVVLVEFGRHLGGMTAGGLSQTDGLDRGVQGGLCREIFDAIGQDVGYRPSLAEAVFRDFVEDPWRDGSRGPIAVYYEQRLAAVERAGTRITAIRMENGSVFRGRMFLDATYEGDLMARAGVSYTVGRESNAQYGETRNGRQTPRVISQIDPYQIAGDPTSGLLPGISAEPAGTFGTADDRVQAYCFRLWVERQTARRPWPQPAGYDARRYEILHRYLRGGAAPSLQYRRYDMNNHKMFSGVVSLDHVGASQRWAEASYAEREEIFQDHVAWQQGLFWFCANDPVMLALAADPTVSQTVRNNARSVIDTINSWGLPLDEYPETNGWPSQLYVREARRMVSDQVLTEAHYEGLVEVSDPVGLANYASDSHDVRRLVVNGRMANEGNTGGGIVAPWKLSYRSIIPARGECGNLLVPWCVSASHVATGSLRMEPTFLVLGQSAATAAALALAQGCDLQDLDYPLLQLHLLAGGQILGSASTGEGSTPGLQVIARDPIAEERDGSRAVLDFVRDTDNLAAAATVFFTVGGSAVEGEDYVALPRQVTIPAGARSVSLAILPLPNQRAQGDRTVAIALDPVLTPGSLGSRTQAVLTIRDAPYDGWRFRRFAAVGLENDPRSLPTADADSDGLANELEFFLGTDPLRGCAPGVRPGIILAPGESGPQGVFEFTRSGEARALDPVVETSPSLNPDSWTRAEGACETTSWDPATGARTLRVRIEIPSGKPVFVRLRGAP